MFEELSIDAHFDVIKRNHMAYLEANIVTHLDLAGATHKKPIIDRHLNFIKDYHRSQKRYLEQSIKNASVSEQMGGGFISMLLGLGIGGLFYAQQQQRRPSLDVFGAKAIAEGGFSALIGASCGAIIYKAWSLSQEKPAHSDYAECVEQMKHAGFSDSKYQELSKKLVKLFHFRECLLLGLLDNKQVNMRDSYINHYFSGAHLAEFNQEDFNLSIEIYFLNKLNQLFHEAFKDIYKIHQQDIEESKEESSFTRWIKKHFESEENQQRFTQQMQVEFMNQCMHFLEKEMSEPGLMAKYIYITDAVAGLIASAIAVGVFAVFIPIIPMVGLAGIGIVSAAIGAVSTHVAINQHDSLRFARSQDNRQSIHAAIQQIGSEQKRLTQLIRKVVKTTDKDLADLKKYDEHDQSNFLKILSVENQPTIFTGSVRSWVREFANRFNDSKFIEIDLSKRVKSLMTSASEQTIHLQTLLMALQSHPKAQDVKTLTKYIEATRTYLRDPENQAFIHKFESIQKIKEQILEVVSFVTLDDRSHALPRILVEFYTDTPAKGGLGGLINDLNIAKRLAPVVSPTVGADDHHPYHHLLVTALSVNLKLNAKKSDFILQGDSQYRQMLGFPPDHIPHIEDKINIGNIEDYLEESFNFLCSLNVYNTRTSWNQAFQNHDESILYRMLFLKQLANMVDPINIRVEPLVKEEIIKFVRTKLNCNPDVALDDIVHQAWLINATQDTRTINDPFGNTQTIGALANLASAIRVDLTYVSNSLTPKQLIGKEAELFLRKNTRVCLFGYNFDRKTPEYSDYFYADLEAMMTSTKQFIEALKTKPLLQQTSTLQVYIQEVLKDVDMLINQMNRLVAISQNDMYHTEQQDMRAAIARTIAFKNELPRFEDRSPQSSRCYTPSIEFLDLSSCDPQAPTWNLSQITSHSLPFRSISHDQPFDKAKLPLIITELNALMTKKSSTFKGFGFHHHSRGDKTEAARNLRDALENLSKEEPIQDINWEDEMYTNNPDLKPMIKKYFPQGLSAFFASQSLSLAL